MDVNGVVVEIDDPVFEDAVAGVAWPFHIAVILERTVSDLNEQEHVRWPGFARPIVVRPSGDDADVWLRFVGIENDRVLAPDESVPTDRAVEDVEATINAGAMGVADRHPFPSLPATQFDPVAGRKNPGLK
jgi:hypothetical protein